MPMTCRQPFRFAEVTRGFMRGTSSYRETTTRPQEQHRRRRQLNVMCRYIDTSRWTRNTLFARIAKQSQSSTYALSRCSIGTGR